MGINGETLTWRRKLCYHVRPRFVGKTLFKPFGVAEWFGLGTFTLEVSNSKPLTSECMRFSFWVELVASGLPSVGYLSCVGCELLHRREGFTLCTLPSAGYLSCVVCELLHRNENFTLCTLKG
ncbi:hypothetical protein H5410_045244 [Solanum commersonii]|uniref:Uncharacterized protein n=1 Tax=Solanum commersonii TaxID=4109 RepID=A0A9J5XAI8_SOLCO|nr:hypothetical protein H5410_045244 [Solanum commersonii]